MSEDKDEDSEKRKKVRRAFSLEYRMQELMEKLSDRVETNEAESRQRSEEARQRSEETQRNIDFIIQQQAQFTTDIQKLSEAQARTDSIVERLATATLRRFESAEGEVSNLERKMEALVDSHIILNDIQKQTDERLNAFIATVERIISERRNGGQES